MKKFALCAALIGTLFSTAASAETYVLSNVGNYSPLHNQLYGGVQQYITDWNGTILTANASGNSTLIGSVKLTNGLYYSLNVTLTDTYFSGTTQKWGNFSGTLVGTGFNISLNDINPTRDGSDAVLGLNATPYNNAVAGGNSATTMEFGFWGDNSPAAGGTRNSDVNTTVVKVPLPGTLALLGASLVGLALRRKRA